MLTSMSGMNSKSAVLFIWLNVCVEMANNKNVTFCSFVSYSSLNHICKCFDHSQQSNFVFTVPILMERTVYENDEL